MKITNNKYVGECANHNLLEKSIELFDKKKKKCSIRNFSVTGSKKLNRI